MIDELKLLYYELKGKDFSNQKELLDYMAEREGTFDELSIMKIGKDDYSIKLHENEFTCGWSKTYKVHMMIEDIVRAAQVLSGIQIEGVHNTPTLISWVEKNSELDSHNYELILNNIITGELKVNCASLEECVEKLCLYRDRLGMGARDMDEGFGDVFENGELLYSIAYNGRIQDKKVMDDHIFYDCYDDSYYKLDNELNKVVVRNVPFQKEDLNTKIQTAKEKRRDVVMNQRVNKGREDER